MFYYYYKLIIKDINLDNDKDINLDGKDIKQGYNARI